jgi:tetratricopeptide (TPR) repeat protein
LNKRKSPFFLTLLLGCNLFTLQAQNDSIRFIQAHRAVLKGEFAIAIPLLTKIIEHKHGYEKAWRDRGSCYLDLGKLKEALADYNMAIQLDSTDGLIFENRGILFSLKKKNAEALADFKRAILLDSSCISAYCSCGSLLNEMKRFDEAENYFRKAVAFASGKDKANCYYDLGFTSLLKGNYVNAVSHLTQAIDLNPNLANAYKYRAEAYFDLENYQAYEEDIVKERELNRKIAKK